MNTAPICAARSSPTRGAGMAPAIGDALNWLGGLESRYPAVAQAIRRARAEA